MCVCVCVRVCVCVCVSCSGDKSGMSDPYIKLKIGDKKFKTKVRKKVRVFRTCVSTHADSYVQT